MELAILPTVLHILLFLTSPIHWIIFVLACFLVVAPTYAIRRLVKRLAEVLHPTWGPIVSSKDGIMAEEDMSGKPNSVITVCVVLDGSPSLEEVQGKLLRTTVLAKNHLGKLIFPKFQQYTERWLGFSFWKWDPQFKIENHVRHLLPTFQNEVMGEDELHRQLGLLANAGFKPKRPHWEILYVKNFIPNSERGKAPEALDEENRKSIIIHRFHHGIADGYSLLKCLLSYACQENLDKVHVIQTKRKNFIVNLWNTVHQLALLPYCLFRQLAMEIDSNVWFLKERNLARECNVKLTKKIPLGHLKEIRKHHGVSLGAVMYAVLGGAIGKYFQRKYDGKQVPELIRSFTPLPWKNHPKDEFTNHWTCAVIPILTGIQCPLERLRRCEEELEKVKTSSCPLSNYTSVRMVGTLPGWAIEMFGRNWYSTCILSNFPGPTNQAKYFAKYPMLDVFFVTPHLRGSAGIGISIVSYADNVRYALNFDKAIIPLRSDLDELSRLIEDEVDFLRKSYLQTETEQINQLTNPKLGNGFIESSAHLNKFSTNNNDVIRRK